MNNLLAIASIVICMIGLFILVFYYISIIEDKDDTTKN